jgi:hypothetical protein
VATAAYRRWIADGEPWHPAQPIAELSALLRRYGYTVGVLGNPSHQLANPPEDHCPYSATGWPNANPYPFVHACDIMPSGDALPSLGALGRQLADDKDAGVAPWIKYMNWSPPGQGCEHWKWQPNRVITPSGDIGHIHLSIRSDATHTSIGGYDPVARVRGGGGPQPDNVPAWPAGLVLHRGSTGEWVHRVQQRLHDRGWRVGVDGIYGPQTETVVRKFQAEKGIRADGRAGPQTWRTLWTASIT